MPAPRQDQGQAEQAAKPGGTTYEDKGDGWVAGNLTRQPELRYTPGGRAVASMRVAETSRVKNAQTGKWEDGPTEFSDVTAWGEQAEHLIESLSKGDRIVAVGTWQEQSWADKDGQQHSKMVLVARDLGPSLLFRQATVNRQKRG